MDVVVLGSGMAGLGAAHQLQEAGVTPRLFDKNPYPGGHTASFTSGDGFIFDDGPHISFTKDERIQTILAENVGGAFETVNAKVNNYWHGTWIKHPVQCNLRDLPDQLKIDCLKDFIAAAHAPEPEIRNYQDWLDAALGKTIAATFPAIYGKKYHTVTPAQMTTDWIGPRIYRPEIEEVLSGAIRMETPDVHYVSHFRYPKKGGFAGYLQPFFNRFAPILNHEVTAIDPGQRIVSFANGVQVGYDRLISSIPLPALIPMIKGAPPSVRAAAAQLACTSCMTVNIGIAREDFAPATWTYIYDEDISFTRLSFPHLLSPETCPPGHGAVQAECYFSEKYAPVDVDSVDWIGTVVADLKKIGVLREDDTIKHASARLIPFANIIFDHDRQTALTEVHGYLEDTKITPVGRYGEWGYQWTDEAFTSGEKGAEKAMDFNQRKIA